MKIFLNRNSAYLLMTLLFVFLVAGCGDTQDNSTDEAEAAAEEAEVLVEEAEVVVDEAEVALAEAEEELVKKMATIATAIEAAPATTAAILEKYGMTAEEYEAEIYNIAQNPALSAAFEKAKSH